ncbi:MAG: hypothetical protein GY869_08180 [Planctomycetes bacterium]|nr:hypothetical protein [Planctomycetota bacterium]
MQDNDKELLDLLGRFSADENELRTTLEEIRRGDELLFRQDQIEVKAATLEKTNVRVRAALSGHAGRTMRFGRVQRALSAAAGLLIALGGMAYWLQSESQVSVGPEIVEPDVWMVLVTGSGDEFDLETNDMIYAEILHYWAEDDLDVDEMLKRERDGESDTRGVS